MSTNGAARRRLRDRRPHIPGGPEAVRTLLALAPVCLLGWLAAAHRRLLDAGADRLSAADRGWLLAAAVAAAATWVCAAVALQGAVVEPLPPARLLAAQVAASTANHLLPTGVGASAVNLRFLTRCGLTAARGATALAVKGLATGMVRLVLLAVLGGVYADASPLPRAAPHVPGRWLLAAAFAVLAALGLATAALVHASGLRTRLRLLLATGVADVGAVHRSATRTAALWGGSLAFPCLHAVVLIAVIRALAVPVPPGRVLLAYLAASSAAVLLPTPGGLGSLDAALTLALLTAGATGPAATAGVLGYRLLTVWLPLAPGVVVFAALIRRKAL